MKVVHVYVGEKRVGVYPECVIMVSKDQSFIYVVPRGTAWEDRVEKYVCAFPTANSNVSAMVIRQEDKK
jgi:hypothetical protein